MRNGYTQGSMIIQRPRSFEHTPFGVSDDFRLE
jgi:hypothetical protein